MNSVENTSLIDETKSSLQEVLSSLAEQKSGTKWAKLTNTWASDYVLKLTETYGDVWCKGFLPKEFFLSVLLPAHGHDDPTKVLFPLDTPISKAKEYYKNTVEKSDENCLDLINYLKNEIYQKGFTSSIILAVINRTLKHVDGLHRMIALDLLLEEGYAYKPIPVFLCKPLGIVTFIKR